MSILNVNTIQPIGSGTTVTIATTELKASNFITIGTGASVTSPSANVLTLGTNNAERFRIASNGNTGIGTNNPGSNKLQIQGSSAFYGNGGASATWGDTSYLGALSFDGSAQPVIRAASSKALIFQVNQSTEALRITSGGLVGIGTDNPNSAAGLDVLNGEICARGVRSSASKPISGVWLGKAPGGGNAVIELVGDTGSTAEIDFTAPNTDTKGRVAYDLTNDYMYFNTNGANERLRIRASGQVQFSNGSFNDNVDCIMANSGTMEIGAQSIMKFRTATNERLRIDSNGHVLPGANNTYDLGSTAKGWRNVYMNDLNLSNMNGDTNDVDGTQGSWTIQEGKDDLYIINRLNGKKFKIKMEEIS